MEARDLRYWAKIMSLVASFVVIGKSLWHLFNMIFWGRYWDCCVWIQPYREKTIDLPAIVAEDRTMSSTMMNGSTGAGIDAMPIAPDMMYYYNPYPFLQMLQQIVLIVALLVIIIWAVFLIYQSQQLDKTSRKWQSGLFIISAVVAFIGNFWLIGLLYLSSGAIIGYLEQKQGVISDESDV